MVVTVEGTDDQTVYHKTRRVSWVCVIHMLHYTWLMLNQGSEAGREVCNATCGTFPGTEIHQRSGVVLDSFRMSSSLWKLCVGCMNESRVKPVI